MIKFKTSNLKAQTKLSTTFEESTLKTNENPTNQRFGEELTGINPPPKLESREEYQLAHMSMSEAEFDKVWVVIMENRKKAEKCGK